MARRQWLFIASYGALLTAATLGALLFGHYWLDLEGDALVTVSFLTLAFGQLFHVFNMREAGVPIFRNAVTLNPYVWLAVAFCSVILLVAVYLPPVADALSITPPSGDQWLVILVASALPLLFGVLSRLLRAIAWNWKSRA